MAKTTNLFFFQLNFKPAKVLTCKNYMYAENKSNDTLFVKVKQNKE